MNFKETLRENHKVIQAYDKMMEDFDQYTKEEINSFPLEIRCCYYIVPFNKKCNPKSIEQWAKEVGWINYNMDGCFQKCATRIAIEEANRLLAFIQKEIKKLL